MCSHGGLYSLDSVVSGSIGPAFSSFDDLFGFIEVLLRIDALFGSVRLKLPFVLASLRVVFDSLLVLVLAVFSDCCCWAIFFSSSSCSFKSQGAQYCDSASCSAETRELEDGLELDRGGGRGGGG